MHDYHHVLCGCLMHNHCYDTCWFQVRLARTRLIGILIVTRFVGAMAWASGASPPRRMPEGPGVVEPPKRRLYTQVQQVNTDRNCKDI
jgi:hypothetical protein